MRRPQHLSPTSMSLWAKDPGDYYLRYMSDTPPPKEPQNQAMAIGAAFDALVKNYLHEGIFGKGADPRFEKRTLFEAQVSEPHRKWAWDNGDHVLGNYRRLGALDALMIQLGKTVGPPRFEMDVRGMIYGRDRSLGGVPFFCKPDLFFVNEQDAHVILDWKVNGYCADRTTSPTKGYVMLRQDGKSRGGHAETVHKTYKGIVINGAKGIEHYDESWGRQLATYSWVCGEEVGAPFVAMIHQVVCSANSFPGMKPTIRIAEHASHLSKEFQENIFQQALEMWTIIQSDHIFRGMSKEESIERCKVLDQRAAEMFKAPTGDAEEDFYARASR